MGKPKDTKYYCEKCNIFFPVRKVVAKQLEQFNKKAFCTKCDSDEHTSKYKKPASPQHRGVQSSLNDKPSPARLNYIHSLGGTRKPKTNKEAGEMIEKLKKLRGN